MTNDYKERLLKYLTNNYQEGTPSTTPIFASDIIQENISTNIYSILPNPIGYIQGKDAKGNDLDVGFIYGNESATRGVIIIVDGSFNVLQTIKKYSSGDYIAPFTYLNIDNSTGQIYGIDWKDNKYRFIQFTNFLLKKPVQQYEVKIRNTAFLNNNPAETNMYNVNYTYIEKNPATALYILIGSAVYNNTGEEAPFMATYRLIVGADNELVFYPYKTAVSRDYIPTAYNIIWAEENYQIKIGTNYTDIDLYYQEFTIQTGDTELTLGANVQISSNDFTGYTLSINDIEMTNTKTYIAIGGATQSNSMSAVVRINYNDSSIITLYKIVGESGLNYHTSESVLTKRNGTIYFNSRTNENAPNNPLLAQYLVEMGLIDDNDNVLYKSKSGFYLSSYQIQNILFNIMQNYNLITYHLPGAETTALALTQIYNANNYNYEDYQAYNSLKPNSGIIYSNNNVVFARNLYNLTINGNTTGATIEIPNVLLNGISLTKQNLLGQTNGILVNNTNPIEKNIYEDLFINFYNTITIQNQNTPNYIKNLPGSIRLNNSVSNTLDYANATITKIRFNYSDETTYIRPITGTQLSQFKYKYEFNVYTQKTIDGIDFISNDESTIYQTIDGSNFETNTLYKVTQEVEII